MSEEDDKIALPWAGSGSWRVGGSEDARLRVRPAGARDFWPHQLATISRECIVQSGYAPG